MECPFCGEELITGYLTCPNCWRSTIDFDYLENMEMIEEKYSKSSLLELSQKKLTFDEIITILTYIERRKHHYTGGEVTDGCIKDETFSNLGKQLNEMRNR